MTVVFLIVTALHVKYATIFLPGLFLAQGQRLSKKTLLSPCAWKWPLSFGPPVQQKSKEFSQATLGT